MPVDRPLVGACLNRFFTGCLPLFFFGFCEQGQIFYGLAKSRIWWAFLSFGALNNIFKPFWLLFLSLAASTSCMLLISMIWHKAVNRAEEKDKAYPCSYPLSDVLSQQHLHAFIP
jgi:hypothetical protein